MLITHVKICQEKGRRGFLHMFEIKSAGGTSMEKLNVAIADDNERMLRLLGGYHRE